MISARDLRAAVTAVSYDKARVEKMAATILRAKIKVYRATLRKLAEEHDVEVQIKMSEAVKQALAEEALFAARSIARSRNSAAVRIGGKLARTGLNKKQLETSLRTLLRQRQDKRREMVAVTEAYTPHADAVMAFYRDGGAQARMTFGGRPEEGDQPAECVICQAIIDNNPWSIEEAIRIGNPHPNCRQSWHAELGGPLPDTFVVGDSIAGVVNKRSLIERAGSRDAAAEAVRSRSV